MCTHPGCDAKFGRANDLRRHMRLKHGAKPARARVSPAAAPSSQASTSPRSLKRPRTVAAPAVLRSAQVRDFEASLAVARAPHRCGDDPAHVHGSNCGHKCVLGGGVATLARVAALVVRASPAAAVSRVSCRALLQKGRVGFLLEDGSLCFGPGCSSSSADGPLPVPESDAFPSKCVPDSSCVTDQQHTHAPGCGHPMVRHWRHPRRLPKHSCMLCRSNMGTT